MLLMAKQFFGPSWYTTLNLAKSLLIVTQTHAVEFTSDIAKCLLLSVGPLAWQTFCAVSIFNTLQPLHSSLGRGLQVFAYEI